MSKRKSKKQIPRFRSEDEEREFWATHDSTDYVDWKSAVQACMTREALTVGCHDESSDNASWFCAKKNRFLRVLLQARWTDTIVME